MDLIDGYCRLENDTDDSVIYRPNKGVLILQLPLNGQRYYKLSTNCKQMLLKPFQSRCQVCTGVPTRHPYKVRCFTGLLTWHLEDTIQILTNLVLFVLSKSTDINSARHSMGEQKTSDFLKHIFLLCNSFRNKYMMSLLIQSASPFGFSGSDIYCEILDERPKSGLSEVVTLISA